MKSAPFFLLIQGYKCIIYIMSSIASLNIEFSHIYINENFNSEHKKAAEIVKKILKDEPSSKSITTTVLIDDYNPTESFFVEQEFLANLDNVGIKPDYLAYEAKLTLWTEEILREMTGKLQRKYLHYVVSKGKSPCSLLVAIWHLIRLGALELKFPSLLKEISNENLKKPFIAQKILTILPHRYESVEESSREIIRSSRFSNYLDRMETQFF